MLCAVCVCMYVCVHVCVCAHARACVWYRRGEERRVLHNKLCRTGRTAEQFNNSVLVSALLVQGQGTEMSLQSSLFVAI